ncbi:1459_t:CDS:2, partial [Diversispora eburnea]
LVQKTTFQLDKPDKPVNRRKIQQRLLTSMAPSRRNYYQKDTFTTIHNARKANAVDFIHQTETKDKIVDLVLESGDKGIGINSLPHEYFRKYNRALTYTGKKLYEDLVKHLPNAFLATKIGTGPLIIKAQANLSQEDSQRESGWKNPYGPLPLPETPELYNRVGKYYPHHHRNGQPSSSSPSSYRSTDGHPSSYRNGQPSSSSSSSYRSTDGHPSSSSYCSTDGHLSSSSYRSMDGQPPPSSSYRSTTDRYDERRKSISPFSSPLSPPQTSLGSYRPRQSSPTLPFSISSPLSPSLPKGESTEYFSQLAPFNYPPQNNKNNNNNNNNNYHSSPTKSEIINGKNDKREYDDYFEYSRNKKIEDVIEKMMISEETPSIIESKEKDIYIESGFKKFKELISGNIKKPVIIKREDAPNLTELQRVALELLFI